MCRLLTYAYYNITLHQKSDRQEEGERTAPSGFPGAGAVDLSADYTHIGIITRY